jgi:hypothetical protein
LFIADAFLVSRRRLFTTSKCERDVAAATVRLRRLRMTAMVAMIRGRLQTFIVALYEEMSA